MNSDFFHYLHDTIILLGGGTDIAKMVENHDTISDAEIDRLRQYNCKLMEATRKRLVGINKATVRVGAD